MTISPLANLGCGCLLLKLKKIIREFSVLQSEFLILIFKICPINSVFSKTLKAGSQAVLYVVLYLMTRIFHAVLRIQQLAVAYCSTANDT